MLNLVMAQFSKRRVKPSPNKNEAKIQRNRDAAYQVHSAGVLGQRYPDVERLRVELDFTDPRSHAVEHKTSVFGPSDACHFKVPCPGRCGQGSYDLAGKINAVIEAHEAFSESNGTCQEPLYAGAQETCGYHLKCKIEVRYKEMAANGGENAKS